MHERNLIVQEPVQDPLIVLFSEERLDSLGHLRPHAGHCFELVSSGLPDLIERAEVARELPSNRRPYLRDAKAVDEPMKLDQRRPPNRIDEVGRRPSMSRASREAKCTIRPTSCAGHSRPFGQIVYGPRSNSRVPQEGQWLGI